MRWPSRWGSGCSKRCSTSAYPIGLLLAALILATAVAPIVDALERRMPRAVGTMLVYLALLIVVVGVGWLTIPRLVREARALVDEAPAWITSLAAAVERWTSSANSGILDALQSWVTRSAAWLVMLPFQITSALFELVIVIVMSAYLVISLPGLRRFTLSLVPEERRDEARDVLAEMGRTMGGFVRGTLIDAAAIVGVIVYVGLLLLGVPFTLVLALISAVGELVPTIGPIVAAIPAVAIALLDSPTQALLVLAFYVAVQQLETHLLLPLIMRNQADVPPTLAIFAVLAGGYALGVLGALIAIPVAGALRVLVVRVVAPYVRRRSGPVRAT
ncbi:MAG: AI-2E family transporter [Chloroflexota bacterium]|nr:AI-2E family transporter [Chloroflexota bacterium]